MTIHLAHHDLESGHEAWCGEHVTFGKNAFATPGIVTCEPCLEAAADYGGQVARRLVHIRYTKMRGLAP